MRDLLPDSVLQAIRDRYLAGVADAEAMFDQSSADEDSVTGALGQAIAMPRMPRFITSQGNFEVEITYRKLRGRGKGAPEKKYGADGVFQIEVKDGSGAILRKKALPFQSKKGWRGTNGKLLVQAVLMQHEIGGGLVVDYESGGYFACTAEAVVAAGGNRAKVKATGQLHSLGQILGNDFLNCTIGVKGLFFDKKKEQLLMDGGSTHVITTSVQRFTGPERF